MVPHTCSPSAWEVEEGGLGVQTQPWLHRVQRLNYMSEREFRNTVLALQREPSLEESTGAALSISHFRFKALAGTDESKASFCYLFGGEFGMCAMVCGGFSPSTTMWAAGTEHRRLGLVAGIFTSRTISLVLGGKRIFIKQV